MGRMAQDSHAARFIPSDRKLYTILVSDQPAERWVGGVYTALGGSPPEPLPPTPHDAAVQRRYNAGEGLIYRELFKNRIAERRTRMRELNERASGRQILFELARAAPRFLELECSSEGLLRYPTFPSAEESAPLSSKLRKSLPPRWTNFGQS
jgi:hypothetical protein